MKDFTLTLDSLTPLIEYIVKNFTNGVIVLQGDLAAGKTTLVQQIVKYLGYKESVTSPTFSLQQCYGDTIFHYDLYNHGLEHFTSLGMLEELDKKGLHFVEWGDEKLIALLKDVGIEVMSIAIKKNSLQEREYSVCIH